MCLAKSHGMGQQQQQRAMLTGVVYANAAAQLMKMIYVSSAHQANNTADIESASSLYHDYVSLHFYQSLPARAGLARQSTDSKPGPARSPPLPQRPGESVRVLSALLVSVPPHCSAPNWSNLFPRDRRRPPVSRGPRARAAPAGSAPPRARARHSQAAAPYPPRCPAPVAASGVSRPVVQSLGCFPLPATKPHARTGFSALPRPLRGQGGVGHVLYIALRAFPTGTCMRRCCASSEYCATRAVSLSSALHPRGGWGAMAQRSCVRLACSQTNPAVVQICRRRLKIRRRDPALDPGRDQKRAPRRCADLSPPPSFEIPPTRIRRVDLTESRPLPAYPASLGDTGRAATGRAGPFNSGNSRCSTLIVFTSRRGTGTKPRIWRERPISPAPARPCYKSEFNRDKP